MTVYFCNAFSINMIRPEIRALLGQDYIIGIIPTKIQGTVAKIVTSYDGVRCFDLGSGAYNAIGHKNTDGLIRSLWPILQSCIPVHTEDRKTIELGLGDIAIVFQYSGARLPEGGKELPEGAKLETYLVRVENIRPNLKPNNPMVRG